MRPTRRLQFRLFPELERLPTRKVRQEALKCAWKQALRSPRPWLVIALLMALSVVATVGLSLGTRLASYDLVSRGLAHGLIGFAQGPFWLWVFRQSVRAALRRELVKRGYPICLKCAYDLRGQIDPRCPECGTAFDAKLLSGAKADTGDDVES